MILLNILLSVLLWNIIVSNLNRKYKHSNRVFCGLIGYSGPDPFDKNIIRTLLYISSIERGIDSTGTYTPEDGIIKSIDPGWKFSTDSDLKLTPSTTFIGHVRAKTRGVVNVKNAHPFHRGNCILAHNGTLTNSYDLRMKYDLPFNDYDVDSDILCGSLAKAKNIAPIKEIDGAAALLIVDTEDPECLFIYRKGATHDADIRPLYRGNIGSNVYICSIKEALVLVNCSNIKEFKLDTMYTIKRGVYTKDAFKIKNTPYKHVITTSAAHNQATVPDRTAKGCYIRANTNFYATNATGDTLTFEKNHYYLVVDCLPNYKYVVQNPKTLELHQVFESRFTTWDAIKSGNWVRAIVDDIVTTRNTKVNLLKDTPVLVETTYFDGEMSLKMPELVTADYVKKNQFKKLTPNELKVFLATGKFVEEVDDSKVINVTVEGVTATLPSPILPTSINSSALVNASLNTMSSKDQANLIDFLESQNPSNNDEVSDIIVHSKIISSSYEKLELIHGDYETIRVLHKELRDMTLELEILRTDCDDFYVDDTIKDRVNKLGLATVNLFNKLLKIKINVNS